MIALSPNDINNIWITICCSLCVISWTAQGILYNGIKKYHYQKWLDIGEPGFATAISNDISKFKKAKLTFRYFVKGDIELDADIKIKKLRILNNIIFVTSPIIILFFIAAIIYEGLSR
jgi:hypothetical protein